MRDLGELRIPYDRDFNERTRLVCLKQNPSLPALVLDSVSDSKYSFFENLIKGDDGPAHSTQIHPGGEIYLRQWKNVNPSSILTEYYGGDGIEIVDGAEGTKTSIINAKAHATVCQQRIRRATNYLPTNPEQYLNAALLPSPS